MTAVLDTSVLLALLWDEPGADKVAPALKEARVSAVNLAELVSKLIDRGASEREAIDVIGSLGLDIANFDAEQALTAGLLRRQTRELGLSIGDRACLALARRDGAVALTADRSWGRADVGVAVEMIR